MQISSGMQGQEVFFQDFAHKNNVMYNLADSSGACMDSFWPSMTIRYFTSVGHMQPSKINAHLYARTNGHRGD